MNKMGQIDDLFNCIIDCQKMLKKKTQTMPNDFPILVEKKALPKQ